MRFSFSKFSCSAESHDVMTHSRYFQVGVPVTQLSCAVLSSSPHFFISYSSVSDIASKIPNLIQSLTKCGCSSKARALCQNLVVLQRIWASQMQESPLNFITALCIPVLWRCSTPNASLFLSPEKWCMSLAIKHLIWLLKTTPNLFRNMNIWKQHKMLPPH